MINHEEYLGLNEIQRHGSRHYLEVPMLKSFRKNGWISLDRVFDDRYELTSLGRLEHNLYEKIQNYSDGCKAANKHCPRCGDEDPDCRVCCGYTVDGKYHH